MIQIPSNSVVVDADFANHLCEIKDTPESITSLIKTVFDALNYNALMHPLVYEKEIFIRKNILDSVLASKVITVASFHDFLGGDPDKEAYYSLIVHELYRKLNGCSLNIGSGSIFSFWIAKRNLGEIHSIAMCAICGCSVLLSDDQDSKSLRNIIRTAFAVHIDVFSRAEVIAKVDKELLSRKERRAFEHKQ